MDAWPPKTWDECDRPIRYAVMRSLGELIVVPVKVWSMTQTWNGVSQARTITRFPQGAEVQVDHRYKDVFETEKAARTEVFKRMLKGTVK